MADQSKPGGKKKGNGANSARRDRKRANYKANLRTRLSQAEKAQKALDAAAQAAAEKPGGKTRAIHRARMNRIQCAKMERLLK